MPKVKFLQDFQGKETGEVFYRQGQEAELPDHMTQILLADRRVELVNKTEPVIFENVTNVETVVIEEPHFADEPKEEAPKPKRGKRGKKHETTNSERND